MNTPAQNSLATEPPPTPPPTVAKPSLLEQIEERGISLAQWHTLSLSLYPGARPASVLLVIDYCRARKLDPLKKPCHIVPLSVKDAATGEWSTRDVVMPGIYELRTTAHRTGEYLGHSSPEYGPEIEYLGLKAPEWCRMTFYREAHTNQKAEFPSRVLFREVVTLNKSGKPTERWQRAPVQMMTKCCEAAGLRDAFPDELGGQITEEEVDRGGRIDAEVITPDRTAPPVEPLNRELGIDEKGARPVMEAQQAQQMAMAISSVVDLGSRRLWQHCIAGDACATPPALEVTIFALETELRARRETDEMAARVTCASLELTLAAAEALLDATPNTVWRDSERLERQKRYVIEVVIAHHEFAAQQTILGRKAS